MAQTITLEGLRSQIVKSIFGRQVGLAYGNSSDITGTNPEAQYLVGVRGIRRPTVTLTTSSTGDLIPASGTVLLTVTTTSVWPVGVYNPIPGESVLIVNGSTAKCLVYVNGSTATTSVLSYFHGSGMTTGVTTGQEINLPYQGAWARLTGLSTALWLTEVSVVSSASTAGSSMT
jgi:hypothetical protein